MLPANHLLTAHKRRISGSQVKGIRAHKKALKVSLLIGGVAAVTERRVKRLFARPAHHKADAPPMSVDSLQKKDHFTEAFPF